MEWGEVEGYSKRILAFKHQYIIRVTNFMQLSGKMIILPKYTSRSTRSLLLGIFNLILENALKFAEALPPEN